uniref:TraB domain-containing protein n=1 Tax=Globodera rostochiensis TaxID=31243 RepID=A0A914I758_GLORO
MSIEQNGWKHGPASEVQSAVSQVDSASNYIADAADQQIDEQQSEEESDEEGEAEDEEEGPEGTHTAAAASDESTRHLERRFYVDSKVFLYDGFAFGRNRPLKPNLNKNTVSLLKYPFEPATIPSGIDSDEFRRAFSDAQVYLVGTAHFSLDSCRDVMQTVTETQPDFVMVLMREAQALTRQKIMAIIRENGIAQGLMQVLLLSLSAHITQQLGMAPGGEFRAANAASKQRALGALGPLQRLKFFFHLAASLGMDIKQEDVERCKDMDMLEELLKQMAGEFPQISRILVDERDQYMTQVLHTLLQRGTMEKLYASKKCRATFEPVTVVAVVGMGHVAGIRANWTKHIDGAVLLTVPRPSMKSRIFKSALKLTFFGLLGYGVWRVGYCLANQNLPQMSRRSPMWRLYCQNNLRALKVKAAQTAQKC